MNLRELLELMQTICGMLLAIAVLACNSAANVHKTPARYPEFSWDKVPVAFHFGKRDALMRKKEAEFIASHSNFICLEKGHASRQFG